MSIIQGKIEIKEEILRCNFCEKILSTKQKLKIHKENCKSKKEIIKQFECQYCDKILSTKRNLESHIKNCGITKEKYNFECKFCKKNLSTKRNLDWHINICLEKKDIELKQLKDIVQNKDKELKELKENNIKLREQNENYKKLEENYKKQNEKHEEQIKDLQNKLENLANKAIDKPTIISKTMNTNNIVNNLAVYDNKLITDRFTNALSSIKPIDLYDGQESISRFIAPCLKNEDGTQLYKCTDYSRGVYIKKDKDGNIIKDINGKNLVELIEPIASKKAEELLEEDNIKRDKQRKLKYLKNCIENKYKDLENLKMHIQGYEVGSDSWKYHETKMKTIENNINNCIKDIEKIEKEGISCELDEFEYYDDKLTDGVNDIKNLKKDQTKFSKNLARLMF